MTETLTERYEAIARADIAFNRLLTASSGDPAWMDPAKIQHSIVHGFCLVAPTRLERWDSVRELEDMAQRAELAGASW